MAPWWPLKSIVVTGAWGNSPAFYKPQLGHNGIDLACPVGTPVYAIEDGTVAFEGWGQNHSWMGAIAGISAIIRHSSFHSGYAHLSQTIVSIGQAVKKGQLIGYSGNTGGSTGPHLHVEVLPLNPNFQNGYAGRVNPATLFTFQPYGSDGSQPLTPTQRLSGSNPVKRRAAATTQSAERQPILAPNTVANFIGFQNGELVDDGLKKSSTWFKGISGDWFWAGGFTSQATTGLPDLTPTAPPVKPPVVVPPVDNYPTFTAFDPVVTKVEPAHKDNYQLEPFPEKQHQVVLHDFGTDGKDSFAGTVSWFKNKDAATSSHFVVSGDNIVQMVSLKHRAWHAGPGGNDSIGIEIDPAAGRAKGDPLRDKTVASVNRLLVALEKHYGNALLHRKHPEFMATACGDDIHLEDYALLGEEPKPPTGDLEESISGLTKLINSLMDLLKKIFRVS